MTQAVSLCQGRSLAALLLLCSSLSPAVSRAEIPPNVSGIELRPGVVSAAGKQVAELEVADFGRYAIAVRSAQGTALQVLDRMSGAGDSAARRARATAVWTSSSIAARCVCSPSGARWRPARRLSR